MHEGTFQGIETLLEDVVTCLILVEDAYLLNLNPPTKNECVNVMNKTMLE